MADYIRPKYCFIVSQDNTEWIIIISNTDIYTWKLAKENDINKILRNIESYKISR